MNKEAVKEEIKYSANLIVTTPQVVWVLFALATLIIFASVFA